MIPENKMLHMCLKYDTSKLILFFKRSHPVMRYIRAAAVVSCWCAVLTCTHPLEVKANPSNCCAKNSTMSVRSASPCTRMSSPRASCTSDTIDDFTRMLNDKKFRHQRRQGRYFHDKMVKLTSRLTSGKTQQVRVRSVCYSRIILRY